MKARRSASRATACSSEQVFARLRNRGRANHLVAQAVAQVAVLQRERHPPPDVRHARLGHHVRDAVAHAEVGGDGAVELVAEDGEDVRRRAADVHREHVRAFSPCAASCTISPTARGVDITGALVHVKQLVIARRLRHHVFEEEAVNGLARRGRGSLVPGWAAGYPRRSNRTDRPAPAARPRPRRCCRRR